MLKNTTKRILRPSVVASTQQAQCKRRSTSTPKRRYAHPQLHASSTMFDSGASQEECISRIALQSKPTIKGDAATTLHTERGLGYALVQGCLWPQEELLLRVAHCFKEQGLTRVSWALGVSG